MKKTGYDQFFKAAQKARGSTTAPPGRPRAKRSKPFPLAPILTGGILIPFGIGYFIKPDLVNKVLDGVEIRFMGQVSAEETPAAQEKPAAATASPTAKNSAATADAKSGETAKAEQPVS